MAPKTMSTFHEPGKADAMQFGSEPSTQPSPRNPGQRPNAATAATGSPIAAVVNADDERQFTAFVTGSRDRLLRALRTTLSPQYAVEALADAYAYVWSRWEYVAGLDNPVGYVYRVAERAGIRAEIRDRKHTFDIASAAAADFEDASTTQIPWFDTYRSDDRTVETLRALPPRQRACVLLIHAYGWKYKEAAEVLSLPLTTVTNEATRGLQRLRNNAAASSNEAN
jgi:DNA-directed RNA polymerase specialized sigma24 family protein